VAQANLKARMMEDHSDSLTCMVCGEQIMPSRRLASGTQVADCAKCAAINLLGRKSDEPGEFKVIGVIQP
jgi:hypothetical protein